MNIIENIAQDFLEENYISSSNTNFFLSGIKTELARQRKDSDKIIFLSTLRNSISNWHDSHYEVCKEKDDCDELKWHQKTIFYLNNMLDDYSIQSDQKDWFSENEKIDYSDKLDKIINDIQILKKGQEVIYDNLTEEIEELKNLYHLGKKNWKHILVGKTVEMITGGVISETISKELINLTDVATQNLLK